jgi:hypothetical protein
VQDVEVGEISDWKWNGPTDRFKIVCKQLGSEHLLKKVQFQ